jgi:hypothetical protein
MSELREKIVLDRTEDKLHIAHEQDVSDILDSNRASANAKDKHAKWNDFERVASIPAVVVMEWMKEGINVMAPNADDKRRMKAKLNSPEYAYLRTRGGRL